MRTAFLTVLAVLAIASVSQAARPSCPGGVCPAPVPQATVRANPIVAYPAVKVYSAREVRQARVAYRMRNRGR